MIARSAFLLLFALPAAAGDWPQWGGTSARNMVSSEKHLPDSFGPGQPRKGSEEIDPATTKNVKWVVKLGSQTYGNPTIAGGRVFVGTNNESPRDPRIVGDRGVLMAFDETSGRFLWQLTVPKLGSGKVNDWEFLGITSSPTVDGDRIYLVTNRGEVVALDAGGLADGNDGATDEGAYMAGPGQPPLAPGPADADIVWRYDLKEDLGVFPHNATSSAVMVVGQRLFVTTSNGVDWGHTNIPSPLAPSLAVLDKTTGKLLGEESSGISKRILHSNWSSPAFGAAGKQEMVIFAAGDGWCYGFDPVPRDDAEGLSVLRELWRFDGNPARYRTRKGKPIKYATAEGPSEFIATPVFHEGKVYAAIGQDPEHGSGLGNLSCIDVGPGKKGDITKKGRRWSFDGIGRSISTVAIDAGLLYAADFDGKVYCLDAATGKLQWTHDTESHMWGSPFVADGKVYIGNEDGVLTTFAAGRALKILATTEARAPIYSTPVAANGVLYVATQSHLYAAYLPTQ